MEVPAPGNRTQQAVEDNMFLSQDRSDRTGDPHMKDGSKKHFRELPGDMVWEE